MIIYIYTKISDPDLVCLETMFSFFRTRSKFFSSASKAQLIYNVHRKSSFYNVMISIVSTNV